MHLKHNMTILPYFYINFLFTPSYSVSSTGVQVLVLPHGVSFNDFISSCLSYCIFPAIMLVSDSCLLAFCQILVYVAHLPASNLRKCFPFLLRWHSSHSLTSYTCSSVKSHFLCHFPKEAFCNPQIRTGFLCVRPHVLFLHSNEWPGHFPQHQEGHLGEDESMSRACFSTDTNLVLVF